MSETITFQPELRPELPLVDGPKEYHEQRALFIRLDELLALSDLDCEFFELSVAHQKIDLATLSAAQQQSLRLHCSQAIRCNLARMLTGLSHREFCIRLADSALLPWFLQIGRVDGVKCFSKSSSDRFAHLIDADSLQKLNIHLVALLGNDGKAAFDLEHPIRLNEAFLDSTCLKASVHHPVDWVLLRDATRTLMKSVWCIREKGLLVRMPKEPHLFISEMNTLAMAITAKNHTPAGRKHRKKIFRQMKSLLRRIVGHADRHLARLKEDGAGVGLSEGRIREIVSRMETVLTQITAIIRQAHERIIGGRKLPNKDKIFSLYDPDVQVIKRGKAAAEIEFGNNLWLGESRDGFIIDYCLEKTKTGDSKQVLPAIERIVNEQSLPVTHVWGDRGLQSAGNEKELGEQGIYSGLCPRNISELSERLQDEPQLREGLKRRAGTEARISILIRKFMGTVPRAKGFKHREMMVGWAVLTHNLWKLARLQQAEQPPTEKLAPAA